MIEFMTVCLFLYFIALPITASLINSIGVAQIEADFKKLTVLRDEWMAMQPKAKPSASELDAYFKSLGIEGIVTKESL